jgi:CubicO group peptidase (beta-lactamase class C family)
VTPIHGSTDPRFQTVRDAFAANFCDHGEVGAALCVYVRGRCVVDLWGGIADLTTGTPWAEDTLQYVFSTSAHGYHAHTFGWLVGKVIRRITGRTPGTFFADEIATPLNLDAYIGLPPGHQHRVSRLIEPPAALHRDSTALRRASAVTRPRIDPNDPRVHAAEIPSSNGITTARAIARFYNTLIDPTEGYPLLAPATGYALPSTTFPGRLFRPRRPRRLTRLRPPARISTKFGLSRRLRHSASSASVSNPLLDMCEPACCRLIRQSWSGSPPEPCRV